MNRTVFPACRPEPLSSYLKGLGVLRLVAEQQDPDARGYWDRAGFAMESRLDTDDIITFLLDDYSPSPFITPWNGGGGFHPKKKTDKNYVNLLAVENSTDSRFEAYRTTIRKARHLIAAVGFSHSGGKKASGGGKSGKSGDDSAKARLIAACRANLDDVALDCIDTILATGGDPESHGAVSKPRFNPLLGTGGNDGKLDYSGIFLGCIKDVLIEGPRDISEGLLRTALLGVLGKGFANLPIGMFDPGRAGGYNQGPGIEHKDFPANPWDFILMLEGTMCFSSALTRRGASDSSSRFAAFPFTVEATHAGHPSRADGESNRGESWLPTWSRPAGYLELRQVFAEGRCQVGRRQAANGLDFARSLATFGVDRGFDTFVRYAYLARRGDAHVALPAGRFKVRGLPEVRLLDDADRILARLHGLPKEGCPLSLLRSRRRLEELLFACAVNPSPRTFRDIVTVLGQVERIASKSASARAHISRPFINLSPEWIDACDLRLPEVRIAAATASIRKCGKVGPVRSNLSGVNPVKPWLWDEASSGQQCWRGSTFAERLARTVERRLLDAVKHGEASVPLKAGLFLAPEDAAVFLRGQCNEGLIEELLWGFQMIDWSKVDDRLKLLPKESALSSPAVLPRSYALIKRLFDSPDLQKAALGEKRIVTMLVAGRPDRALEAARRRLSIEMQHPIPIDFESDVQAVRLAAGLALPVARSNEIYELVGE